MPKHPPPGKTSQWRWLSVMVLILLVGAILRFYHLDSLPPGLFFDEAINGLDAQNVWRNGRFSIFFPANYGREPLYIYLQALIMKLIGEKVFNMRLVSAYAGLLTIPLVFTLGKTLFHKIVPSAVWIGTTAAAALAVSYWHVALSRLGFRTILLPFFVMLTLLFVLWGYEREQRRWFILAGVTLGLSQYTYLAARVLPLLLIGLILSRLFLNHKFERNHFRTLLVNVLLMSAVALLIYAPLGKAQFFDSSANISTRVDDVSLVAQAIADGESVVQALWQNIVLVARMFVDQGDTILRHNLPGRPVFDWLNLIGFLTGLVLLLRHWRRPQSWLLVLWLIIMLLPTILATQAPHYLRASGAIGAVAIIVGIGLVWLWQKFIFRVGKQGWVKRPFTLQLSLPLFVLIVGIWFTANDYFIQWPQSYYIYDAFDGYDYEAAVFAQQKLEEGDLYLIPPADWPARPTPVLQLMLNFTDARPLAYQCHAFQPQAQTPVTYLIRTFHDRESLPQLQEFLPSGHVDSVAVHPHSGEVWYQAYTVYPEQYGDSMAETAVSEFGNAIRLANADWHLEEDTIQINMTWQTLQPQDVDHTIFLHLYAEDDVNGQPVAQLDVQPCHPTSQWQVGEALHETYILPLTADLPPGQYSLAIGWYTWPSFERLQLTASEDPLPDQRHQLGQITIND